MADLEAFSSVEVQPVVYCRASRIMSKSAGELMTWRQVGYEDLFHWPHQLPVVRYAEAWDRRVIRPNGLTFARFRERMRQIAIEALSYVEGVIVVHDFQTLLNVVRRIGRCIVLPMDDDDWLCPDITRRLSAVVNPDGPLLYGWPQLAWWCNFNDAGKFFGRYGIQTAEQAATVLASNSYAFSHRVFQEWPEDRLKKALDYHWTAVASVPQDRIQIINEHLSFEVKHIGCTSILIELAMKEKWWNHEEDEFDPPLWVKEHCDKVRELHALLVEDMGGRFEFKQMIRETEKDTR